MYLYTRNVYMCVWVSRSTSGYGRRHGSIGTITCHHDPRSFGQRGATVVDRIGRGLVARVHQRENGPYVCSSRLASPLTSLIHLGLSMSLCLSVCRVDGGRLASVRRYSSVSRSCSNTPHSVPLRRACSALPGQWTRGTPHRAPAPANRTRAEGVERVPFVSRESVAR